MATPAKQHKSSDLRLDFATTPPWQKECSRQQLLGTEYAVYEPSQILDRQPVLLDFVLESERCFLPGPMSKFKITGGFEMLKDGKTDYEPVPDTEFDKVLLCPNW